MVRKFRSYGGGTAAGFSVWLGVLVFCFLTPAAVSEVEILAPPQRAVVFGGSDATIEIPVVNRAPAPVTAAVEVRLFQLASSVAAPVGERRPWKAVSLLSDQTAIERLEVRVPDVRAVSLFRVICYSGEKELGRCSIVAIPPTLLTDLAKGISIAVADPQSALAAEFRKLGMDLRGEDQAGAGSVVLFGPMERAALLAAREKIKTLTSRGATVVVFLQGREFAKTEAAGLQGLTGIVQIGTGKVLYAKQLDLADFAASARSQLALHELLSLAVERDAFPWLRLEE